MECSTWCGMFNVKIDVLLAISRLLVHALHAYRRKKQMFPCEKLKFGAFFEWFRPFRLRVQLGRHNAWSPDWCQLDVNIFETNANTYFQTLNFASLFWLLYSTHPRASRVRANLKIPNSEIFSFMITCVATFKLLLNLEEAKWGFDWFIHSIHSLTSHQRTQKHKRPTLSWWRIKLEKKLPYGIIT